MIVGTLILEEMALHFELPERVDGKVHVTVADGQSGESRKLEVDQRGFAASLALAMDFEGMEGEEELQAALYRLAEPVVEGVPLALRWIP